MTTNYVKAHHAGADWFFFFDDSDPGSRATAMSSALELRRALRTAKLSVWRRPMRGEAAGLSQIRGDYDSAPMRWRGEGVSNDSFAG